MQDIYYKEWMKQLNKDNDQNVGNKLKTYKQVKKIYKFEHYLKLIVNYKIRRAITKLRISSHNLPIEQGRYNRIPHNERICKLCNKSKIGDEKHYIMDCSNSKISEYRQKFFHKNSFPEFDKLSQECKYIYLLIASDTKLIIQFSNYVYSIFNVVDTCN